VLKLRENIADQSGKFELREGQWVKMQMQKRVKVKELLYKHTNCTNKHI